MRNIDQSHFGPDFFGKINVAYQNAKKTKSKGSIKRKFLCLYEFIYSLNSFMLCLVRM
jgi:hypothetical protein